MTVLTREQSKQDVDYINKNILEVDTEDDVYKMLVELNRNDMRNLIDTLIMNRNILEDPKGTNTDKYALRFDIWK